jgi:hypothetical protein
LLVGAALALWLATAPIAVRSGSGGRHDRAGARHALGVCGVLGTVGLVWAMTAASSDATWLYRFGFLGIDIAVAALILTCVATPGSLIPRALSIAPLRFVGRLSYGIYIWHFPLFLWLNAGSTGQVGRSLVVLRIVATFAAAMLSYVIVEQPVRQRRLPRWILRPLVPVAAAAAAVSLITATAAARPVLVPPPVPAAAAHWTGGSSCRVVATDTSQSIVLPPSPDLLASDPNPIPAPADFRGSAALTFHTCPPKRLLVIGDSLAATLGVGLMQHEQRFGEEIFLAPLAGCGYGIRGEIDHLSAGWIQRPSYCADELVRWRRDELATRAQAVVVEMGWRDSFDVRVSGRVEHLGNASYDEYLRQRIQMLVQALGRGGVPVLLLTVPRAGVSNPDGTIASVAKPRRHDLMNGLLSSVARQTHDDVGVFALDSVVSPDHRYATSVDGEQCRISDNLHFTVFCGELLQPGVLSLARRMLAKTA